MKIRDIFFGSAIRILWPISHQRAGERPVTSLPRLDAGFSFRFEAQPMTTFLVRGRRGIDHRATHLPRRCDIFSQVGSVDALLEADVSEPARALHLG